MRNIKIVVAYDGAGYRGWQRQKLKPTVQEVLEEKIGIIANEKVKVIGSGRTDAGVHALRQVAHFKTSSGLDEGRLLYGINSLLPSEIVVKELKEVDKSFHAQHDVVSKIYLYQIYNEAIRSILYRNYAWHIPYSLNLTAMREAADFIVGCHDFSSFCATGTDVIGRERTIMSLDIKSREGLIRLTIMADGFLRYMVRNIVGTLVDVGRGKLEPRGVERILQAKDRKMAGMTAPPYGLFLKEVIYRQ